ncbi:hypothetical protein [Pseudidiomarina donghaiensis]|uniref:DUF3718 domain-containing protein n=1 Tax=Pseudidiomarina donghaiensis TaxID=519452 RepID=A0A432XB14_9GAMM|nr:hypothetical protein [Pseudidiomarina donghaiensis]RUO45948.1 hypothetical protein CWE24_12365 [Pseudidiomarina donghaiensis]SFV25091.1 hypothetical protein SAMN04488139_0077 [Pseudidiomarina donghaiensis]
MVKNLTITTILLITFMPTVAEAKGTFEKPDAAFLINACQAVTEIYNAHNEKRFLASQTTSLADAMRAGYCLGVMKQYQCRQMGKYSLFESARRIAILDDEGSDNIHTSVDRILRQGVCR